MNILIPQYGIYRNQFDWPADRHFRIPVVGTSVPVNRQAYDIGDSLIKNGWETGSGINEEARGRGWIHWALCELDQRIVHMNSFAVGGAVISEVYDQYTTNIKILSKNGGQAPGFLFISAGGVDLLASQTEATLTATKKTMLKLVDAVTQDGTFACVLSIGVIDGALTDDIRSVMYDYGNWLIELSYITPGLVIIDGFQPLIDPNSATGEPFSDVHFDANHPNQLGAQDIGIKSAAVTLLPLCPVSSPWYVSADDQHGVYQNYVNNATMTGNSGTASAGVSADGVTLTTSGTMTATGSKLAYDTDDPYRGDWQRVTLSNGANGGMAALFDTLTPPDEGTRIYGQFEVRCTNLVMIASVHVEVRIRDSGRSTIAKSRALHSADAGIAIRDFSGSIRTPVFTVPALADNLQFLLYMVSTSGASAAAGLVDVRRNFIREPQLL